MQIYNFKQFTNKINEYLDAVPIDSVPTDAVWEEMATKIASITLTLKDTGYIMFDKGMASDLIEQHVNAKKQ